MSTYQDCEDRDTCDEARAERDRLAAELTERDVEIARLREIEARAKLVVAEWPRAGRISEPMADQLEALRELLREG